jgi:hypothetical protein
MPLAACREMPRDEYVALLTVASDSLTARQHRLDAEFHFAAHQRFDWDEEAGLLVFSDHDTAKVISHIQFVGEVTTRDSSWRWSWGNDDVAPPMQRATRSARWYGWRHGIRLLRQPHWTGDQQDGWEMTALTAWITDAVGAYRAPYSDSSGYSFPVLRDMRRAPPGTLVSRLLPNARE